MTKSNCFKLYWLCKETGKKLPAGVAFYNEDQGDYRLKVDVFPDDKLVFLKTVSLDEGSIKFRVEIAVKKNGLIAHRAEIGAGHAQVSEGYPIYMNIGPFSRTLVLEES